MNKSSSQGVGAKDEVDLTPMLDVVFILLIFFIVTSTFVKEKGIGVYVPQQEPQSSRALSPIIVRVMGQGQFEVDHSLVAKSALSSIIRTLLSENEQRSIVVQVNKQAKLNQLVLVLDRIRIAGRDLPAIQIMEY